MALREATFYMRGATLKFQYFLLIENEIKVLGKLAYFKSLNLLQICKLWLCVVYAKLS